MDFCGVSGPGRSNFGVAKDGFLGDGVSSLRGDVAGSVRSGEPSSCGIRIGAASAVSTTSAGFPDKGDDGTLERGDELP